MGFTSWATIITVTCSRRQISLISAATEACVGEVEAVERLVQQQQRRPMGECLRDEEPLLLAAGELADRAMGVGLRADELDEFAHPGGSPRAARSPLQQRDTPARAVQPQPHDVDPAHPQARRRSCGAGGGSRCRGCASPGGGRGCRALPAVSGSSPSAALISVDLPAPFGPRIATNSPCCDAQVHVAPDDATADGTAASRKLTAGGVARHRRAAFARACSIPASCVGLPLLIGRRRGRHGLGDARDRECRGPALRTAAPGRRASRSGCCRRRS